MFALAATARASVQLLRDWHEAPLAYAPLRGRRRSSTSSRRSRSRRGARRLALGGRWCVELVGVLVVGAFSVADPEAFPRATVWSGFGSGYGYVPLVLPLLGLAWLRRARRRVRAAGRARRGAADAEPQRPPGG